MALEIPETSFPRVIVIGGGFGGIQVAKKLRNKEVQVLVLDQHNYHTFQPLLYQVATGGLEPDSIAFPLRKIFKHHQNIIVRLAKVDLIQPEKKTILTSIGEISYDFLVIATGSKTNFFGNQEIKDNSMPMKSIPEALNLRSLILQNFEDALLKDKPDEQAQLINFVIVGGGPTGVETAGALAELKLHVLPNDYPDLDLSKMQINIIERAPRLLNGMSEQASKRAEEFLTEMGVRVRTNDSVKSYNSLSATLESGVIINTSNLIWTAGVKAATIAGIDSNLTERGSKLIVDLYNTVIGYEHIFAIGDVCAMQSEDYPNGHPGVAQAAIQQGKNLAHNIINIVNDRPLTAFKYNDLGAMATIGRNKAVVDLPLIRFQGVFAWFVWMFLHLLFLVGFRNKLIVLINWIWNYFSYDNGTRLIIRPFRKNKQVREEEIKIVPRN
jgi:NADH dehydrogenase